MVIFKSIYIDFMLEDDYNALKRIVIIFKHDHKSLIIKEKYSPNLFHSLIKIFLNIIPIYFDFVLTVYKRDVYELL